VPQPPSLQQMLDLAEQALADIPLGLREHARGIAILIEEFPDDDVVRDMGLESPFDLLGLYSGVSLDHKSGGDVAHDQDRIFLYRRPILDFWCETGEDLGDLIRHVLIHEIGHHFGLSDEDMEALEADED
jgi:predicted Zn-dependent protease with MMP-like domain